ERGVAARLRAVTGRAQRARVQPFERLSIRVRHGEHEIEPRERIPLEAQHATPLLREEAPRDGLGGMFRVTSPNLRFDVMRKEDGRAGQSVGKIYDRRQEVAYQRVEALGSEQLFETGAIGGRAIFRDGVRRRLEEI